MKLHLFVIALLVSVGLFAYFEADWLEKEWFSWKGDVSNSVRTIQPEPVTEVVHYVSRKRFGTTQSGPTAQISILDSTAFWFFVFVAIDATIALYTKKTLTNIIQRSDITHSDKLSEIANQDILFDLPLYVGLFGTILGFILLSHGYSSSRDAAYISTVVGIVASAIMRLSFLRSVKTRLYEMGRAESRNRQNQIV